MSSIKFTTADKLAFLEELIEVVRAERRIRALETRAGAEPSDTRRFELLKALAADTRARLEGAPSAAMSALQSRLDAVDRSKTGLGYSRDRLISTAEELIARWPVVKQSLELFGHTAEDTQ